MTHAASNNTLQATVQTLGDTTVIHLAGRLVRGEACRKLGDLVLDQVDARAIVLNLAEVDGMDASGIGTLLRTQESVRSRGTVFQLMNAVDQVHRVLVLTGLDRAFEFCSIRDQFCLIHRSAESQSHSAVA